MFTTCDMASSISACSNKISDIDHGFRNFHVVSEIYSLSIQFGFLQQVI